jgi:YegS/Rv2252/BmrU family lipid kinase
MLTSGRGDARERLREVPAGVDAVFVLGGDGTVMEVTGALAGTGVPVGVLPGGTGNLVAGVLRIPRSVRRAVARLVRGKVRRLDLGRMARGPHFAFAAGVGIDVDMVRETRTERKRAFGLAAYVVTALRSALRLRRYDVTAEVDGQVVRSHAVLAMVANSGALFGGLFVVGPEVEPDDGQLDLCLFSPTTVRQVMGIIWRIVRRDFSPHPQMRFLRGRRIRLSTDPPVAVQADGDLAGETPVDIEVQPGAACFLVP